ncbi:hypothetical protein GM658_17705 [Pseudoduganella eburnea]|uniref:Nicotinamide riboside transporter PnuC n=1 Tax=Massilia eburnea TaxID=1776165 RepID=A0A6L6QKJ0_9BURK|nr:hypothetical protein [Massilia eburnea]MTW12447.1 hypothetical protein [Massilia eburnea]
MTLPVSSDPTVASSARWFWWIAGLSLVNLFLFYSGSNTNFVIGLGMTAVVSAAFSDPKVVGLILSALIIGHYGVIGYFALRDKLWAFYIGLAVYILDALVYAAIADWMPVAFHAYVIFHLFKGISALRGRSAAAPAPMEQAQPPEAGA